MINQYSTKMQGLKKDPFEDAEIMVLVMNLNPEDAYQSCLRSPKNKISQQKLMKMWFRNPILKRNKLILIQIEFL